MDEPLYPDVTVKLSGYDGSPFFIALRARSALRRAGVPEERCEEFFDEALPGDYDHVLQTVMKWADVE